jgi:hypothetical protein
METKTVSKMLTYLKGRNHLDGEGFGCNWFMNTVTFWFHKSDGISYLFERPLNINNGCSVWREHKTLLMAEVDIGLFDLVGLPE